MGKKKKKLFPAYFFGTQPFDSSRTQLPLSQAKSTLIKTTPKTNTGFITSMGPGLSLFEQTSYELQKQSMTGGIFPAYVYYGRAGLLDPKLPIEAYGWGGVLGLTGANRGLAGGVVALVLGFTLAGVVGVAIDPMHQWEGGLDETADYQTAEKQYLELKAPWKTHHVPLH